MRTRPSQIDSPNGSSGGLGEPFADARLTTPSIDGIGGELANEPPRTEASLATADPPKDRDEHRRWMALLVLCAGFLMIVLDKTIVDVALPTIQRDLRFSVSGLAWVVNAYLIAFGGLLLLAGRLGDLLGRRRIFLAGLALFTSASLLAGLADSQALLTAARFIQGIGGAMSTAVILGMIVTMFPQRSERAKAIGIYSVVASAGGGIGLLAGGVLVQLLSWHWIFFVNVPIGVLTGLLATRLVPDERGVGLRRGADAPSAVLLVASLMLVVYTLQEAGTGAWGLSRVLGFGAAAVALLAAFVMRQARAATPLMPLRMFGSRTVNVANTIHMGLFGGVFGMSFFGALYMQRVLHYDAIQVGLAFLPFALAAVAASAGMAARAILRFGARATALAGLVLTASGLLLFSRAPVAGHFLTDLLPAMLLIGTGAGLACPALMTLGMSAAAPEDSGLASGLVNTAEQYGGALGLAVLATLASNRTGTLRAQGDPLRSALTGGYHLAFTIGAALVVAGIALAVLVLRDPRQADAERNAQPAAACSATRSDRTDTSSRAAPTTAGATESNGRPTAAGPTTDESRDRTDSPATAQAREHKHGAAAHDEPPRADEVNRRVTSRQ